MIIIYGTRGCGFCKMAVEKCKKLRIEYEYRDIGLKKWYLELTSKLENDYKVPKIFVDDRYIGDYNHFLNYIQEEIIKDELAEIRKMV